MGWEVTEAITPVAAAAAQEPVPMAIMPLAFTLVALHPPAVVRVVMVLAALPLLLVVLVKHLVVLVVLVLTMPTLRKPLVATVQPAK